MFHNFLRQSCTLWYNVKRNAVEPNRPQMTLRVIIRSRKEQVSGGITKTKVQTHTLTIYTTSIFSTATVVTRTSLTLTLHCSACLDICLAVHHSITFLLLPTWYTDFLFIHTNYIKLNSSTCFERNPLIIRRSTKQIVYMQPLVSSLSASDRLVQPLRKELDTQISCSFTQIT